LSEKKYRLYDTRIAMRVWNLAIRTLPKGKMDNALRKLGIVLEGRGEGGSRFNAPPVKKRQLPPRGNKNGRGGHLFRLMVKKSISVNATNTAHEN